MDNTRRPHCCAAVGLYRNGNQLQIPSLSNAKKIGMDNELYEARDPKSRLFCPKKRMNESNLCISKTGLLTSQHLYSITKTSKPNAKPSAHSIRLPLERRVPLGGALWKTLTLYASMLEAQYHILQANQPQLFFSVNR